MHRKRWRRLNFGTYRTGKYRKMIGPSCDERGKRSEAKRAKIGDATSEASRAKIGNATSEAKRSEAKRSEAKIGVS